MSSSDLEQIMLNSARLGLGLRLCKKPSQWVEVHIYVCKYMLTKTLFDITAVNIGKIRPKHGVDHFYQVSM